MPALHPARTGLGDLSVRELIARLAQVEDAIGASPTFTRPAQDGTAPTEQGLLALLASERDVIAELRRPARAGIQARLSAEPDLWATTR